LPVLILLIFASCKKDPEPTLAIVTTSVIKITQSTATCEGLLSNNGGATVTEKGFCWSTNQNPGINDSKVIVPSDSASFAGTIAGLSPNITYYLRSYAINSAGVAYGNEQSITLWINTPGPGVDDAEGNRYTSVKIGTQVWMVENLRATKYRNGDLIGTTTPATADIQSESSPKYQWAYDGNENNVADYSRLYTWHAVADTRNIAPAGWHVATQTDWAILIEYLGGQFNCGGKLKNINTTHWKTPNTGATNESGFTALPGGSRSESGAFGNIGFFTYWWSSSECLGCPVKAGIDLYISSAFSAMYNGQDHASIGCSVRCVKD
jgi:uncharacterized protein (TIGR02145 family)